MLLYSLKKLEHMNFIKNVFASMLGTLLAFVLATVLFIIVIAGLVGSASSEEKTEVKENSVLHLTLDAPIVERGNESDFNFNASTFEPENNMGLNHFLADVKRAATDEKIKGIFLELGAFSAPSSTILDVREALEAFKKSGKWIVAYSENYTQGGYFVASCANEVYLYPTGSFDWRGLNAELMFFKNMLDKLEIDAQVIRGPNNKFKSAVEPYMYDKMSDANREQMKTFIDDIWNTMLSKISASRQLDVAALNTAADSLSTIDPKNAVALKFIDGLKYRDEVLDKIRTKLGIQKASNTTEAVSEGEEEKEKTEEEIPFVTLSDYHKADVGSSLSKEQIAVVYAVGAIESGEGDDATIGSDRIAKALKEARENKKVKAIVLRVNSPGGSALASDVIWRETELIKQSGKPFVVSMGDYAASGGYYIACSADKIFANPTTITGSIGVFGVLPNMQRFFNNKLGITFDSYETNPHADYVSLFKPLDEMEMKAMQQMVTTIYDDFTMKVAKGRNKTQAEVDSIGQGRVWSGEDAKSIGLVDELGNLEAAVKAAAAMAGTTDYGIKEYPKMVDPFEQLLQDLSGQKQASVLQEIFGESYVAYREVHSVLQAKGPQMRMPFSVNIR
jgi:protease IV